jgi:hypothetical protein
MKQTKSKVKAVSKKEIRTKIKNSVNLAIVEYKVVSTSKKVKKEIQKASRKIANTVNDVLKRSYKKIQSAKATKGMNGQKPKVKATA